MIRSVFKADGPADQAAAQPDTQRQVNVVTVPRWTELKTSITTVEATLRSCPSIGWALVMDRVDRFILIEANPAPGLHLVQTDPPFRKTTLCGDFSSTSPFCILPKIDRAGLADL